MGLNIDEKRSGFVQSLIMESTKSNYTVTSLLNLNTTFMEEIQIAPQDTFIKEMKSYTAFKIQHFINIYWFPFFIPISFVGNTLSFLVMIKPNNRKISTCIYMAAISINDNIMMIACFHDYFVSGIQLHKWNHMECKLSSFTILFALQNGTYQVLAMTLDKYIAIKWPHKAVTYSIPGRAKLIVVGLSVFAFVYNIPPLFLSNIIDNYCYLYGSGSVISRVYSWLSFVLNAIGPFTMLIHMNFVIVRNVRMSGELFKENATNTGMDVRQKKMKSAEKQVTIMLVLVTTLFLILLCPTYVRFIYLLFAKLETPLDYANTGLFVQITYKLYTLNNGINFFLYCISGHKFRNDLREILCNCRRKNQLQSSTIGEKVMNQT